MPNTLPKYLTNRRNTIQMVLWTALFSELFITIYQPYNSRYWFNIANNSFFYFGGTTLAVLVATVVIALSRTILHQVNKKTDVSILAFSCWITTELLSISLVYALFASFVGQNIEHFLDYWGLALIYTTFVLLIPYSIVMLSLILQHTRQLLEQATPHEEEKSEENNKMLLHFLDEKGELRLSIQPDALYYIEGAENYVQVHYENRGKIRSFLLRNTLRNIENMFDYPDLTRCHRSYIVNFSQVRVIKRTEDGLVVDFDRDDLPNLPVSKTYSDRIMASFQKNLPG